MGRMGMEADGEEGHGRSIQREERMSRAEGGTRRISGQADARPDHSFRS